MVETKNVNKNKTTKCICASRGLEWESEQEMDGMCRIPDFPRDQLLWQETPAVLQFICATDSGQERLVGGRRTLLL